MADSHIFQQGSAPHDAFVPGIGEAENRQNDGGIFRKWDANKPTYHFQEFPKMVGYDAAGRPKLVYSAQEDAAWDAETQGGRRLEKPQHEKDFDLVNKERELLAKTNDHLMAQVETHSILADELAVKLAAQDEEIAKLRAMVGKGEGKGPSGEDLKSPVAAGVSALGQPVAPKGK